MMRFYVYVVLIALTAGGYSSAQERGVEFSYMPAVGDTTAGSLLLFEIIATDESGEIISDWDTTGIAIQIRMHNSTANSDTSTKSWSKNERGFTYARLFDAFGRELLRTGDSSFYVPNQLFSNGRMQIAFSHTKAEDNVFLQIVPKKTTSESQTTRRYTFTPGSVYNYSIDITSHTYNPGQVYLQRRFEAVIAARDRFTNVVAGEVPIAYTAQFPGELPDLQSGNLPYAIEGYTSVLFVSNTIRTKGEDELQRIEVYHPMEFGKSGVSDGIEVLNHPPGDFTLIAPPSGTEIQLGDWKEEIRFEWNRAPDPFTDIRVSRFESRTTSDTLRYKLVIADYNNLVTSVSYDADLDGTAARATLTHGVIAQAAKTIHGFTTPRLNAIWYVQATDGIYTTESSVRNAPSEPGHTLQADLRTLDADRIPGAADRFTMQQNYPNPFNPSTTIEYSIPVRTPVRLQVFDVYGAPVATLVDNQAEPGSYRVKWDGTDGAGIRLASGTYLLRLTAGEESLTRVMSMVK